MLETSLTVIIIVSIIPAFLFFYSLINILSNFIFDKDKKHLFPITRFLIDKYKVYKKIDEYGTTLEDPISLTLLSLLAWLYVITATILIGKIVLVASILIGILFLIRSYVRKRKTKT